jgi:hypothetical protein
VQQWIGTQLSATWPQLSAALYVQCSATSAAGYTRHCHAAAAATCVLVLCCCCLCHTGKFALAGQLPQQQEAAVFALLDSLAILWRKAVRRSDLCAMRGQVVEALNMLEAAFPCVMMYIKTHNVLHLVDKIAAVGPLYLTSMFPFERSYRQMKAWIKSRKDPEASLVQNVIAFNMATLYKAQQLDSLSFACSSLFDLGAAADLGPLSAVSPFGADSAGNWIVSTSSSRRTRLQVCNSAASAPWCLLFDSAECASCIDCFSLGAFLMGVLNTFAVASTAHTLPSMHRCIAAVVCMQLLTAVAAAGAALVAAVPACTTVLLRVRL